MHTQPSNPYLIPVSIILAGALVAGAVLVSGTKEPASPQNLPKGNIQALRQVTGKDHYVGNIETAELALIEYSDTECPFCKDFHTTMRQVMADPELNGNVVWVYRHFPIDSLHPKARIEAEAMECAAELGGNPGFWNYTNRLYEITPSNNGLDLTELPNIAGAVGLNREAFVKCLDEQKYQDRIQDDYDNAIETGGEGTPWNLLVSKKTGGVTPINGAMSYKNIKALIQEILAK